MTRIYNDQGLLTSSVLSPEQYEFMREVSRMIPDEQSRISAFARLTNAERRAEAVLMVERILSAMTQTGAHPEGHDARQIVMAVLHYRLNVELME